MYGMAIARIAYTQRAPVSIHGSSKRFRELVTYRERTPISSVSRVRKSYNIEYSLLCLWPVNPLRPPACPVEGGLVDSDIAERPGVH